MPEETKDAPVEDVEEPKAPPVPEVSESSPPESSERPGIDAEALAQSIRDDIKKELDDLVDARFKSGKDKRFSKVDEIYQWVKKAGGDTSKIESDLTISELQQRLEAVEQGRDAGTSSEQAPQENIQAETEDLLNDIKDELGVEFSRDELEKLAGEKVYTTNAQWYSAISKAAVKKSKQGGVTQSAAVGTTGTPVPAGSDQEKLLNEMNDLYAGKHGSLGLPKNKQRLEELAEELNKLDPPKNP